MTTESEAGGKHFSLVKMHGAHNTFVILDERLPLESACEEGDRYASLARTLCATDGPMDGADGILVLRDAAPDAALTLRIYNADGSEAEMCGNGVRCVARYLFERHEGESFEIATAAGRIGVSVTTHTPFTATVDMGGVVFPGGAREEVLDVLGTTWRFYDVSLGNPHIVAFVDDVAAIDLCALGAALQTHERFPGGTNVHLVAPLDQKTLCVRHYERGVGLTQACGTGAVAAAAVAIAARGFPSPLDVRVPGGALHVTWQRGERAQLTGEAEVVFQRETVL